MNIKSMSPCKINGITENGEEKIFTVDDFWEKLQYFIFTQMMAPLGARFRLAILGII